MEISMHNAKTYSRVRKDWGSGTIVERFTFTDDNGVELEVTMFLANETYELELVPS